MSQEPCNTIHQDFRRATTDFLSFCCVYFKFYNEFRSLNKFNHLKTPIMKIDFPDKRITSKHKAKQNKTSL